MGRGVGGKQDWDPSGSALHSSGVPASQHGIWWGGRNGKGRIFISEA